MSRTGFGVFPCGWEDGQRPASEGKRHRRSEGLFSPSGSAEVVEEPAVVALRAGKAGFSTLQDHPHLRMILLRSK